MSDGMKYDIQSFLNAAPNKGQVILLLGTAGDGPVNSPFKVSDPSRFQALFGDPTVGDLGRAFQEVYDTNKNLDINVMRISGSHATGSVFTIDSNMNAVETFMFVSTGGGEKYNYININFDTITDSQNVSRNAMIVTITDDITMQPLEVWYYYLDDYEVLNDLVDKLNTDSRRGNIPLTCSTGLPYNKLTDLWPSLQGMSIQLDGGDDGLNLTKNDLFLTLDNAYDLLTGYYIDVIVPVGAFFDDTHPAAFYGKDTYGAMPYATDRDYLSLQDSENNNRAVTFHGQLIHYCQLQMGLGIFTHGVMGMNPVEDPSFIINQPYSYADRLFNACGFKDRYDLSVFAAGDWIDSGYYITIAGGEFNFYEGTDQEYVGSTYLVYAAMVAGMKGNITTTNQACPNPNVTLRYEFSRDELGDLSDMGITTFRRSVKHGIVVTNGVTAGLLTSDMHYIANVRMIQLTMSLLDDVIDQYVGQNMQPLIANREIDRTIQMSLSYLASAQVGILKSFTYSIQWDVPNGRGSINLQLMPRYAFEYTGTNVNFKTRSAS